MKQHVLFAITFALAGCHGALGGRPVAARTDGGVEDAGRLADMRALTDAAPDDLGPLAEDANIDAATTEEPDAFTPIDAGLTYLGSDLAAVTAYTLPSSLACAATTAATVTMRNTGDTTWSSAGNYALQAVNSEDLFLTSGETIALGADVPPGGSHTFDLTLSAPGAGVFPTQWQMVRGGVYTFGDVAASNVNVVCDGSFRAYPVVIDGTFTMPAHEQRIAARNVSLISRGIPVTGDDDVDNAATGGGAPDGGIWLSGSFHFEVDATGQNTAASWITVFGYGPYSVNGGIYLNGELHMGSPDGGLGISGLFKNGVVTGYVVAGGDRITRGDDVWNRLSMSDRNYLRGIWYGEEITFVHGRMTGTGVLR